MRTTMHLVAAEDADWLLPLFRRRNGGFARRRLGQLGLSDDRQRSALRLVEKWLGDDGPLTRPQLLERLRSEKLVPRDEVQYHLWLLATTEGVACLGPDRGKQTRLVLARDWLSEPRRHDRAAALAELARRYLRAFGPATGRDMARWSGLGLREVRTGLDRIGDEISPVTVAGEQAWEPARGRPRLPRTGWVRLLGDWDTYLLGHRDRSFIAESGSWSQIKRGGGGFLRPTIVADGVAIGTWRMKRRNGKLEIGITPFSKLDGDRSAAIEREVADIGRFEGVETTLATMPRL